MYFDEPFSSGGWSGPFCRSCGGPITPAQEALRITFHHDPDGARGFTGDYHLACGKLFAELARVMNMPVWR